MVFSISLPPLRAPVLYPALSDVLVHCPSHRHDTQMGLALRNLHYAFFHVNVGLHSQKTSMVGHSDRTGTVA